MSASIHPEVKWRQISALIITLKVHEASLWTPASVVNEGAIIARCKLPLLGQYRACAYSDDSRLSQEDANHTRNTACLKSPALHLTRLRGGSEATRARMGRKKGKLAASVILEAMESADTTSLAACLSPRIFSVASEKDHIVPDRHATLTEAINRAGNGARVLLRRGQHTIKRSCYVRNRKHWNSSYPGRRTREMHLEGERLHMERGNEGSGNTGGVDSTEDSCGIGCAVGQDGGGRESSFHAVDMDYSIERRVCGLETPGPPDHGGHQERVCPSSGVVEKVCVHKRAAVKRGSRSAGSSSCLSRLVNAQASVLGAKGFVLEEATRGSIASLNLHMVNASTAHCPVLLDVYGGPWAIVSSSLVAESGTCSRVIARARVSICESIVGGGGGSMPAVCAVDASGDARIEAQHVTFQFVGRILYGEDSDTLATLEQRDAIAHKVAREEAVVQGWRDAGQQDDVGREGARGGGASAGQGVASARVMGGRAKILQGEIVTGCLSEHDKSLDSNSADCAVLVSQSAWVSVSLCLFVHCRVGVCLEGKADATILECCFEGFEGRHRSSTACGRQGNKFGSYGFGPLMATPGASACTREASSALRALASSAVSARLRFQGCALDVDVDLWHDAQRPLHMIHSSH